MAELIATIVGWIVSFVLEVVPGLKEKWNDWKWKPLSLFIGSIAIGVGIWALVCFAGLKIGQLADLDCSQQGVLMAIYYGIIVFGSNQTAYTVAMRHTDNAVARNGGA